MSGQQAPSNSARCSSSQEKIDVACGQMWLIALSGADDTRNNFNRVVTSFHEPPLLAKLCN